MEQRIKLREDLCVASLSVHLVNFNNAHHFEIRDRKIHNSFGYILDGSMQFSMFSEQFTAGKGDLIFIPEGIRYISHWDGNPGIRFYNIHFTMPKKASNIWRSMQPQRLSCPDSQPFREIIDEMYLLSKGDDAAQMRTYGLFFELASKALPLMQVNPTRLPPTPLQDAIAYIEEHYATITSVQEIAAACYLSESRLYHIFKDHLNITPISYLNHLRVQKAMALLAKPELSIQQIAEQLNFHSEYYFRKTFQKITGVLPSHFRKMT